MNLDVQNGTVHRQLMCSLPYFHHQHMHNTHTHTHIYFSQSSLIKPNLHPRIQHFVCTFPLSMCPSSLQNFSDFFRITMDFCYVEFYLGQIKSKKKEVRGSHVYKEGISCLLDHEVWQHTNQPHKKNTQSCS